MQPKPSDVSYQNYLEKLEQVCCGWAAWLGYHSDGDQQEFFDLLTSTKAVERAGRTALLAEDYRRFTQCNPNVEDLLDAEKFKRLRALELSVVEEGGMKLTPPDGLFGGKADFELFNSRSPEQDGVSYHDYIVVRNDMKKKVV